MERAYEGSISVRFVVAADSAEAADETAGAFISQLGAWVDGSLGSPPFAPWLTAWGATPPAPLELDAATSPLHRVTGRELADGRLWRSDD
jgi:hypothetical protein